LVDFPHPGKLEYFACSFAFDEVFEVDTLRLTVSNTDPYGRWVELAVTKKSVTPFQPAKAENLARDGFSATAIDDTVWGLRVNSIEGDTIALGRFRGQYLLLNFWGEWCKPCLDEIPVLVQARSDHSASPLQIVSFLKSYNIRKARDVIRANHMTWPHLLLSDELESFFKIRGYPTNILIRPDGKYLVLTGAIQKSTFDVLLVHVRSLGRP